MKNNHSKLDIESYSFYTFPISRKDHLEASEREIATKIEANHGRDSWW